MLVTQTANPYFGPNGIMLRTNWYKRP